MCPYESILPYSLDKFLVVLLLGCRVIQSLIFLIFIYFCERDRERQSTSRGGAERGGDTESEAGSRLRAINREPDAGLELMNCEIVTRAEVGRSID